MGFHGGSVPARTRDGRSRASRRDMILECSEVCAGSRKTKLRASQPRLILAAMALLNASVPIRTNHSKPVHCMTNCDFSFASSSKTHSQKNASRFKQLQKHNTDGHSNYSSFSAAQSCTYSIKLKSFSSASNVRSNSLTTGKQPSNKKSAQSHPETTDVDCLSH